jgi:hypothetical protein
MHGETRRVPGRVEAVSETVQYPPRQWGTVTHRQRDGLFPPECACGLPWPCPVAERDELLIHLTAANEVAAKYLSERDELRAEVERLTFLHDLDHKLADQWRSRADKAEAALREWLRLADHLRLSTGSHRERTRTLLRDAPAEQPEAGEGRP